MISSVKKSHVNMWSNVNLLLLIWLTFLAFPTKSDSILKYPIKGAVARNNTLKTEENQQQTQPHNRSAAEKCEDSDELQNIIKKSLTLAYGGNLGKFFDVLNVINDITHPTLKYIGYSTLYDELANQSNEHTSQMMALAYWIKTAMSSIGYEDQLYLRYDKLAKKIPSGIRLVMFGEFVRLLNVGVNEFMFESNITVDGRRLVLTRGPKTEVPPIQELYQDRFYFEVGKKEQNQFYFVIRNNYFEFGSPICQSSSFFNPQRRKIVSCPNEGIISDMKWFVEPVANTTYFKIISWDGTQLYSPVDEFKLDKQSRYVFTWQEVDWSGGKPGYWIVKDWN